MARADAARALIVADSPDNGIGRLRQLIDVPALRRCGWDPVREVFAPDPDDPVFGYPLCRTVGCDQVSHGSSGLCSSCNQRWRASPPGTSFEAFCRTNPPAVTRRGISLCRVCRTPGHERPARSLGLCVVCHQVMMARGQSLAAYLGGDDCFPPAGPRPSFGPCRVPACDRLAHRREPALCESHDRRWRKRGRPEGRAFHLWCSRQGALDPALRVVVLRGLPERARLEVLYGLQCRGRSERRTTPATVQPTVNLLRAEGVASMMELHPDLGRREPGSFLSFTRDRVSLALADPVSEAAKDEWDLRVFGKPGRRLYFGRISQAWLKETAKRWALERLGTMETGKSIESLLVSLGRLSESLRRHRHDGGTDPAALSRADILTFSNDLAHLEAAGRLSRYMRTLTMGNLAQFLREARGMGLSGAGRPMGSLPEDVVVPSSDRIRRSEVDEEGRALPQVVMDQLLAREALDLLEQAHGPDVRAMVELEARVGRRTAELCGLAWECLTFDEVLDEAGRVRPAPVLVHDMPKVGIRGYRLPIDQESAEIIRAQQIRVRAKYPGTPASALALFPAVHKNPRGVKSRGTVGFGDQFRTWVDSLPSLSGPEGGPYDRSGIVPYSFRHSFAQRHADAGTPIEVLAALMGHHRLSTTQVYYRVRDDRKRRAVDLLAALQVDRQGEAVRPAVERLLDSDAVREAIGQVAVPFGICTEPTNVRARGQACPFRHQCFGCTRFRSDPSFLPELRSYLARLLADRERLRAAAPELEDWARNAAIPSDQEIAAVRQIVDRCQELLEDLEDDERGDIDQSIAVLRRARAQLDTSVPVRFLGLVGQSSPTLFPSLRQEEKVRAG